MTPVILSGGSGTRLWPVSRSKFPKQFVNLFDDSLMTLTLRRLKVLEAPWTVTNKDFKVLTDRSYARLNLPLNQIILEPFGRNTAPATAVVCHHFLQKNLGDEVVGIFPADHYIRDEATYIRALRLAETEAQGGKVVTIGIHPSYSATGYGYIETTNDIKARDKDLKAFRAIGFREKPTLQMAEEFIRNGHFFWNAGMFVFKVSVMSEHFAKHMPKTWQVIKNLKSDFSNFGEVYKGVEATSIDYGIMEKLREHVCIPCDIGWSDVGSWDEVAKIKKSDADLIFVDSKNNFVLSQEKKIYAFVDTSDLTVIETSDAVLISKNGSSQKVKDVVEQLKKLNKKDLLEERNYELRPWGRFEILRNTSDFKSKVIQVDPGQQFSYQSHAKRSEHWVIIKGYPEVVLNDETLKLKPGESVFIPQGAKHRMRNPGKEIVEFVEVQVGSYFGEDDIVRYQDDYKRT